MDQGYAVELLLFVVVVGDISTVYPAIDRYIEIYLVCERSAFPCSRYLVDLSPPTHTPTTFRVNCPATVLHILGLMLRSFCGHRHRKPICRY